MRGTPQPLPNATASTNDVLAVLASSIEPCAVGEILRRALHRLPGPVVFLASGPVMLASDDAITAAALADLWNDAEAGELVLTPRPGQVGKSLLWEAITDDFGNPMLADKLANAYQKRTAWGVVNSALWEYRFTVPPAVMVDQRDATVRFKGADLADAMRGFAPSGPCIGVEFWTPPPKLIFE